MLCSLLDHKVKHPGQLYDWSTDLTQLQNIAYIFNDRITLKRNLYL